MSRMMKKAESSKWARNVVAVVTALSLVFMQTPVTWAVADQNANSARSVATNLEEEIAQVGATEVGVSFDHAYIVYNDQVVAEPATKMVVPENAELAFQVEPDNGYEVSSVRLMAGGAEQELAADANGVYRIAADKLTADALISVAATVADSAAGPAVVVEQASENVVTEDIELTYSDDDITVVATVPGDDALLAAAQLVVKPITPDTKGYNYDAYMQALNESDEVASATQSNTLLYDIAFMVDGVEVQPAEGAVKIDIQFKNNQLSEGLGAEGGDVTIVHLPLTDEAKSTANTTAEATKITADDVRVEPVEATTVVDGENQKAEFVADSFSVFSVVFTTVPEGAIEVKFLGDSAPTRDYYLLAVLERNGQTYFAVSDKLDNTKTNYVVPETYGQFYSSNTTTYSSGDALSAYVITKYTEDWQVRDNYLKNNPPYGEAMYKDGDVIDGKWAVSIATSVVPSTAVAPAVAPSDQTADSDQPSESEQSTESAPVDTPTGWSGGLTAQALFDDVESENPPAGQDTCDTILGNAINFGIVTDTFDLINDAQTNVAAKTATCPSQPVMI